MKFSAQITPLHFVRSPMKSFIGKNPINSLFFHFFMFGCFFLLLMSFNYTNTLESGDKSDLFLQKPPFIVVPGNRTFSLSSGFGPKPPFLWKVLDVLVFKIGGRAPKGMRFQIENHRWGLDLRPSTFMEEIGKRLL